MANLRHFFLIVMTMLENKVSRVTATIVAATMLNGCIAPQTYSWKMESVVGTAYKEVGEETAA